jgi:acetyl-CoA carboxylase biotin carboxyl carrier protein
MPLGQEAGAARAGEVDVPAPLLGNFYEAPRPGDPPFVRPGDRVTEETVVGIIEVMKLMNPIRAGVSGTVVAVLAQNGSAVEEGEALIRVRVEG